VNRTMKILSGSWQLVAGSLLLAAPLAVGLAFGRIGCFMAGCCWGDVCVDQSKLAALPDAKVRYQIDTVPFLSPARFPLAVQFPTDCGALNQHIALGLLPPTEFGSDWRPRQHRATRRTSRSSMRASASSASGTPSARTAWSATSVTRWRRRSPCRSRPRMVGMRHCSPAQDWEWVCSCYCW